MLLPRSIREDMETSEAVEASTKSPSKSPGKSTSPTDPAGTAFGANLSLRPAIERVKEFRKVYENAAKERSAYHLDPLKRREMIRMENRKQFSKGLKL
jgi:hypothetical protein